MSEFEGIPESPVVSSNGQGTAPPTDPVNTVDRLALVMARVFHGPQTTLSFITAPATGGYVFRDAARAMLEAMREPTDAMLAAFVSTTINQWATTVGSARGFSAMIDAALQETKP